jgi:hypothetical protein
MWSAAVKWRMLGLVGSVLLLLTAGGVIAALSRHPGTAGGAGSPGSQGAGAIGAEAQTQDLAATWVAHEVIRDAIVSCDPLMCQILQAHGVPAGDLLVLRLGTADPLGSELVVATAAIRSQFGSSLAAVYAPAVIAKFGSGNAAIVIRAIAPDGARAYDTALAADIAARKAAGAQLLHNGRITVAAPAAGYLAAGQADSRLIVTLATLAALNPVDVAAFGDPAPGAGPGVPLRSADLSAVGGAAWTGGSAYVRSVIAFLHAQLPPYRAASVGPVRLASGQTVLRIVFAAPSPLGLLSGQARR